MAAISPNVSSGPFAADGLQTVFPFSFSIAAAGEVAVEVNGAPASPASYTVAFGDTAGSVTFMTAPATGAQIMLRSNPDYLQASDFENEGAYNLATVNQINRRAAIRDLVLKDSADRALKFPRGTVTPELPAFTPGSTRALGYDGSKFVWAPNDAVTVANDLAAAASARAGAEAAALSAATDLDAIEELVAKQPQIASKNLDSSIISSTALVTDADLVVALGPNSLTVITGYINYAAAAAGDIKWQHAGPAAPVSVRVNRKALAPGDTAYSGIAVDTAYSGSDIVVDGGAGSGVIEFKATIRNGPNAGNFNFNRAQNTSNATATVIQAGSYLEYVRLPTSQNFAFASSAIAKLGDYSGPATLSGHNAITLYQPSSISNSCLETMVTGTAANALLFAGTYTITVGGVSSVVTAPAGWTYVPLFSGLPDVERRVRIKGSLIDSDIAILVAGAAPNIRRPPDLLPYYRIYDPAYASYISKDGASDIFTGLYGASIGTAYTATGCGEGHRFNATTTSIVAWLYCAAGTSQVELLQDGVSIAVIALPALGTMERVVLATGLSGTHEYEIRPINSGQSFYCFAIMVDALTASAHANKTLVAVYGDSNTQMLAGEDARTHASFLLAKRRGWANVRRGVGGQSISTWGRDNTALVTSGLHQSADIILTMLGVNDYYYSIPLAAVQTDCTSMLANIRAGNATAPIVVIGIHDHYRAQANGTPYSDANRVLYNARLQAAVAARVTAGDANVFYIDSTGWISVAPGVNLRDAVHLNAAGWVAFEAGLNSALVARGL